ncbi:hypothetical protein [Mesobacillus foraminis]|uniref:Uncharacterized protein n=1 Tax=Mesobacillus foraminis TaxID=279826 RepID=A0A4R2BAR2_9BACI|nr:hypothetical protein [Mesobacillus foraminis]TCN22619.1 hypothetical protein EV146_110104 [Mesobacillus foraminis]
MKTEITYYDIAEERNVFQSPIISIGDQFIPSEGDTLLVDGWGYMVSQREFYYENDVIKIKIFCVREKKKR